VPLKSGSDKEIISQNISELVKSGKGKREAIAIALQKAQESKRKLKR